MNPKFAALTESLDDSFRRLISMDSVRDQQFPRSMIKQGVYLFSERDQHLYVGRSNHIRRRYGRHCNLGATHRMAAFAFRLARESTGNIKASYKSGENSRDGLMDNEEFRSAFEEAKLRIRKMDFRFVEETDQIRQALLEVYCAVVLNARYNDFDNH